MVKFIKDPIYGEIDIPNEYSIIDDLLLCKEMKRLSRIYQLGECFNVFYGSTHSRYSHSLGVYYNAKRFIENIDIKLPLYDRKIILVAALLHDIGHGPRSHCFEEWTGHSHEMMTNKIILSEDTEINKVLKKHKIDPKDIVNIINHKHSKKFYYQIVSSQIDADRLDYLCRDSHFIGASYGKIDSGILLKWVGVFNEEIAFNSKAIDVIESILFARAQMFKQVYINKKVLSYECLLGEMFKRFKELSLDDKYILSDKYNLYHLLDPYIKNKTWDIDTFIEFDDNKLNLIIESWLYEKDKKLSFFTKNYLYNNQFICVNNKDQLNNKNNSFKPIPIEYKFTFYNPKEKIMIIQDREVIEINKLGDQHSFVSKQNEVKYKYYFGLKK